MPTTSTIFIPAGTIVGYSFAARKGAPITGTVELVGDCYIGAAERQEDGSWKYDLAPGRTYFCAGGLATVLPIATAGQDLAIAAADINRLFHHPSAETYEFDSHGRPVDAWGDAIPADGKA